MKVQIATTWLVVAVVIVATLAPSLGGYLLYTESLSLVERTVEEVGRADAQSLYREAKRIFNATDDYLFKYGEVLKSYAELPSKEEVGHWIRVHGLADLYYSNVLDSIAITGIHPTNRSKSFVYYVWIDPLEDGSRDYVYAELFPEIDTPDCPYPCHICYSINPLTGAFIDNIYNYSTYNFSEDYLKQVPILPPGKGYSIGPLLWASSDGTPYAYVEKDILLPPIGGLFEGMYIFPVTDMATFPFEDFMAEYNTDANILLTLVNQGVGSFIIAANFEAGRLNRSCKYDPYVQQVDETQPPCLKTLRNLSRDHQEVVMFLNKSEDWRFQRYGGFWTLRATVYEDQGFDDMASVYLMWYRSVSKVQGEMNHALFLFVGFIAGVVVFDFLIGAAEILLIARPLTKLADATGPLRMMWLDEAESMVEAAGGGVVQIREVVAMREGLAFAIHNLREYKSFMPATLFANNEDSSDGSDPQVTASMVSRSKCSTDSSKRSRVTIAPTSGTALGLSSTKHAAVVIGLHLEKYASSVKEYLGKVTSLLEKIEDCAKASQGQLHGFSAISVDTLLLTWSGFKRDELSVRFSLNMKECIDVRSAFGLVTCGSWQTGNIGTKTYRGFTMQGRTTQHLHRALAFAYYAVGVCGESCVITTVDSAKLLSAVAVTTPVGCVIEGADTVHVAEVASMKVEENDEWMYTLSSEDRSTPLAEMLSNNDVKPERLLAFTPLTRGLKHLSQRASVARRSAVFTVAYVPHKFRRLASDQ